MREIYYILLGGLLGWLTSLISYIKSSSCQYYALHGFIIIFSAVITTINYFYFGFNSHFISIEFTLMMLLVLSVIDIQTKTIPYPLILIAFIIGGLTVYCNPNVTILDGLMGLGVGSGFIILSLITRGAIGMGDAIIISFIGFTLGWQTGISVILYALVVSGLVSIFLIAFKKASKKTELPFIPYMFIALAIHTFML